MNETATLIYKTLNTLTDIAPEKHAEVRQSLYEKLGLPFEKQLALYSNVLGPASAGKLECESSKNQAIKDALLAMKTI